MLASTALVKRTLFVADGHGDKDLGNTTTGLIERDELTNIKAMMLQWYRLMNVPIGIGGVIDIDSSLDLAGEIATITSYNANLADGDLGIDLHLDYNPNSTTGGALIIHDGTPLAVKFASSVLPRWCEATGIINRGLHLSTAVAPSWRGWNDFGFCAPAWAGIIFELGSLNSEQDMAIIRNPLYRLFLGQLIWDCWQAMRE